MQNIKRIAIIGNAGSGKSTLSNKLHKILKLPVYHLDQYFWKPNWIRRDLEEYKKIHDQICDKEEWITDGMNLRLLEYRIQRSDIVIFLDIPRHVCLYRIFKRMLKYYGKETPSSAKGCPERVNREFIKFLKWVWNFKSEYNPKIQDLLNKYRNEKQIYVLKTNSEVKMFIENL